MARHDTIKILIVDDAETNLLILRMILEKEGFSVILADNGPKARELALKEKPDTILLDLMMPGEDGFEVIQFLRSNKETYAIPVIFISADQQIENKVRAFELGAVDYIVKPFNAQEVIARVRTHVRLSLTTRDLIESQARRLQQIHEAQTELLTLPEEYPLAKFSVCYKSIQEAGGDFYEVLPISKSAFGYFISDFSGHDIATSYLTASLKALLHQNCNAVISPEESMRIINSVLIEILSEGKFLTANYLHLCRFKMEATLIYMGHIPPVYIPIDGEPELLESTGDILGIFDEVTFGRQSIEVTAGDRFLFITDGLIERVDQAKIWTQGLPDLTTICRELKDRTVHDLPEFIFNYFHRDGSKHDVEDDVIVMAVEV